VKAICKPSPVGALWGTDPSSEATKRSMKISDFARPRSVQTSRTEKVRATFKVSGPEPLRTTSVAVRPYINPLFLLNNIGAAWKSPPGDEKIGSSVSISPPVVRRSYEPKGGAKPALQKKENQMRVMVIVKATKNSEAGVMPSEKLMTDMGNYNEELVKAGIMLAGDGLHPSVKGKRIKFSGSQRTIVDGPFAETKELIAGYWLWQVRSMEEAVEWARRCPNPMPGEESELEIRPLFEAEDFGAEYTPELRAQEDRLRDEVAKQKS
jgi:hypothetical protein